MDRQDRFLTAPRHLCARVRQAHALRRELILADLHRTCLEVGIEMGHAGMALVLCRVLTQLMADQALRLGHVRAISMALSDKPAVIELHKRLEGILEKATIRGEGLQMLALGWKSNARVAARCRSRRAAHVPTTCAHGRDLFYNPVRCATCHVTAADLVASHKPALHLQSSISILRRSSSYRQSSTVTPRR